MIPPFIAVGDTCGIMQVLALLPGQEAYPLERRRYRCRLTCCGRDIVRTYASLMEHRRRPRERCQQCAHAALRQTIRVGERFGGVVVTDITTPNRILARYDCCGITKATTPNYLAIMRAEAESYGPVICKACGARRRELAKQAARKAALPVRVAAEGFVPATAWPRPALLTGARA